VTIHITIRIQESVPDHVPDPGITAKLSTHTEQMPSVQPALHGPGPSDLDHRPDPGVRSPKSGVTGLSKKYLVDSANLHS